MSPAPTRARLFVALDLPEPVRAALADWTGAITAELPDLRPVQSVNLHLTLCFLGWRDEDEIEALGDLVAACAGPVPDLALGAAAWLPPRRPRVLAVDLVDTDALLAALHERVVSALARAAGYRAEARPFRPHVTVARVRGGRPPVVRRRAVVGRPPDASFGAEALTLYRSRLRREGVSYEPLRRIEL